MTNSIPLGAYLFERLKQLGIGSVFGVPGDYNLKLLDYVKPAGLHWVGNCNELNAAYAADGYSRIHGLGVVVTTFGVGELSAINAIAGAFAERAPVIHIVGSPSRPTQSARASVHHTFLDGEYGRFAAMHAHVTAAQAILTSVSTAADKIDWIIEQAMLHQRPVYLQIPDDMVQVPVSTANFEIKSVISPSPAATDIDGDVINQILERIYSATKPLILVDGESRNLGVVEEIGSLIETTKWPTWTSAFGKGLVNEELANVHGVYLAGNGDEVSHEYFKTADLILFFGPHLSNINTGLFKAIPNEDVTISFSPDQIKIASQVIRDISPQQFIQNLISKVDPSRLAKVNNLDIPAKAQPEPAPSDSLSQSLFYPYINSMFRRGDTILTETGTAAEGGKVIKLPRGCRLFTAVTWLSIGYMLPATLGAALAQRDGARKDTDRTILFIGDGSLQMTAQEISIMVKEKLNVIIFVINNNGYTIERVIHGRAADYNDIAPWNHRHALGLFGYSDEEAERRYFSAKTWKELQNALDSQEIQSDDGVKMIEVFMDQEDCTGVLKGLLDSQISREKASQ
ncbi:thiamine diphosphate-binding protein [Fusarium tricinctum]|uniref:Pyruvate decarboxylase n=1 Tax=Fusarium tricinctum TaxID=61284 RepID=A0A8K0S2U0_9HYPO|nr:thiamine diphosphate-binding protein [Fusarium tricinctum]